MHSTTFTSSAWHQGRYVNGAYDENEYFISSDMLPIEMGIQVLSFSNTGSQTIWLEIYHAATSQEPAYFEPPYQSTKCKLRVRLYDGTGTQISYVSISIGGETEVPKRFMAQYAIIEIEGYDDSSAYRYKLRPDRASCRYAPAGRDRAIVGSVEVGMQYVQWYIYNDGFPRNDEAELFPEDFSEPYPKAMWRITNGYNNGFPYHELLPGIRHANIYPELRENVIRVFDKSEPQNGFAGNGLAILHPTSCISLHNDDRWDIKLKHPLDEWGKWKHLLVVNILKVDGQLFRIKRQKPYIDSSGRYIEVEAKHITTDLADEACKEAEFSGGTAGDFVRWAQTNVMHWEDERYADPYQFNISAAYEGTLQSETYPPATLLGLLVGLDNSLLARTGGELYRDNFDISISPRMQGARDNAFYIRYSLDMVEISQEIDYSDFCTLLYCYDNWGNVWAVSYAGTIQWAIHHQITKIVKFNYAEYDPERFSADCDAMKAASFKPKVTYKMKMAALKNDPKYADFLNLQNYRYGDSGTIYCPELDIETTQKIIEVEKNELTGEIVSITLGNMRDSLTRPSYMGSTISSGYSVDDKNAAAMQRLLVGSNIASLQKFPINRLRIYRIKTLQGG